MAVARKKTDSMIQDLDRNGFALMNEFRPEATTMEAASALGNVLDIQSVLSSTRVPTVQTLRPRDARPSGITSTAAFMASAPFRCIPILRTGRFRRATSFSAASSRRRGSAR
jgi:hypothetical protein